MILKYRWLAVAGLVVGMGAVATPVQAQDAPYRNVISANPFGLLLEFFNAEYERAMTESTTIGIGGSFGQSEDEDEFGEPAGESTWFNGDVFLRFYPSGRHFEGWNFGMKAGLTHQEGWDDDSGMNFGIGFDANRSWLLGKNRNFYVGVGFGLKRLFGEIPSGGLEVIPTIRVVNVGFAF